MRFGDLIEYAATFPFTAEETAALEQTEVFRSDVVGDLTIFRQLADRVSTVQEQLHHSQTNRMGERFEAFGRIGKFADAATRFAQGGGFGCVFFH